MKTMKNVLFISTGLAMAVGSAVAQQGNQQSAQDTLQAEFSINLGTVQEVYDRWAGDDGDLSVSEWDTAIDSMFGEDPINLQVANFDTDGDDRISQEEFIQGVSSNPRSPFQVASQQRGQSGGEVTSILQNWDESGDQAISAEEWRTQAREEGLFEDWDQDGDDMLSEEEFSTAFGDADIDVTYQGLDMDSDSQISLEEARQGFYDHYDTNDDQLLEETELVPFEEDADEGGFFDI